VNLPAVKAPLLYGPTGDVVVGKAAQTPDFDPKFLLSFAESWSSAGQLLRRVSEQPYQYYVWVYACASAIAMNLSRLRPAMYDKDDENKVLKEHPILKLLRRPNPYMTGSQFIEAIVLNLMLPTRRTPGGQCFLVADSDGRVPNNFFKGQVPKALYPFSDENMYAITERGQLIRWELRVPGCDVLKLDPDEVVRVHLYNPYGLLLGMSPYSAAVYAIEGDTKAQEMNRKFMDQGANIGGMLTTESKLQPDQAKELRTEWETRYGGPNNSGRTAILHSGLTYEATAKSLIDLQWIEGRRLNREEVLAAYRVPPFVLGQDTANYASSMASWRTFWSETLIPIAEKMWEPINSQWVENVDQGKWRIFSDLSTVQALKKDYKDAVGVADVMITKHGVPAADAYRALDINLDTKGKPWLEQPLVIGSRVNLSDGTVVGQPDFGTGDTADTSGDGTDGTGDGGGNEPNAPQGEGKHLAFHERHQGILLRSTERDKFWLDWVKRTLSPGEVKMRATLTRYLIQQRNSMMDSVDQWADKAGTSKELRALVTRELSATDFLLALEEENSKLAKLVTPIYDVGVEAQAAKMTDELGDLVNWKQDSPYVDRYVKRRTKLIQKINTSTFRLAKDQIAKAIEESVANKLTTQETANLIKDSIQATYGVRLNNSQTIARTEMASIATTTRFSIMDKEGVEKQEWLSARDEKVRTTHQAADGQVVNVGDRFSMGLLHPCEMGGAPGEVINCRCTVVPVLD
jgi:HK97 family phage portal protein